MLEGGAHLIRTTAVPAVPRLLFNARLAPVTASVVDLQMQRAAIPAMRPGDHRGSECRPTGWCSATCTAPGRWPGMTPSAGPAQRNGSPSYVNTGSWLYEPLLVDRSSPPHPYWPGGAVLLEPGRPPEAIGLLDGVDADELRGPRPG